MDWRGRGVLVAVLLWLVCAAQPVAAAPEWDPAATIAAYTAALNAHDVASALALFDQYGSATDSAGHHFQGQAGLTAFLLSSGFGDPDARVTTQHLLVVSNRAIWTYVCTCAAAPLEVQMVVVHNKISVFATVPPRAAPIRKADAGLLPWLVGLGVVTAALGGLCFGWRRAAPVPRASQGRLLAALMQARYAPGGADSDRVELPAAAITSFRSSDESAGP